MKDLDNPQLNIAYTKEIDMSNLDLIDIGYKI
jgi:hypothetical protein